MGRHRQVVRHGFAKPASPVRIRVPPPFIRNISEPHRYRCGSLFLIGAHSHRCPFSSVPILSGAHSHRCPTIWPNDLAQRSGPTIWPRSVEPFPCVPSSAQVASISPSHGHPGRWRGCCITVSPPQSTRPQVSHEKETRLDRIISSRCQVRQDCPLTPSRQRHYNRG